ncbi:MAG: ribonuclease R [Clostridia bacterium]|nr:ribonuclease R [Clostridia bacterium]
MDKILGNNEKKKIVGTFINNKSFGFVVPDDRKLTQDIFISKSNFGKARNNHKVVVEITKPAEKGRKPEGKIVEVIGGVNEAGIDMLSLIKEYDLPYTFPDEVTIEARKIKQKIDESDISKRKDLRQEIIFTIDGEDAKDLDDAVKVTKLKNGNFKLDVHIADVSHYVREKTELEREAYLRGTSIYMLGRVIPMLPRELSNGICSLNAGEDRFALSCTMEINSNGEVINSDIYKSVIKVTKRMSYTDVQKILDNSDMEITKKYEKYIDEFKNMEELAYILKEKRKIQGYLNLDIPESKIDLDKFGRPISISKYETTFAHEIIEQFMLKANETVAERFFWLQAPFIYRVHEKPDIEKVEELNKFLHNLGYRIKIPQGKIYPKEFSKVLEQVKGKPEEKVVSNLILRTLKVARYEAENKGHFGIASNYYCHFTSPIRRYPDLFIHRIISKYIEKDYIMNDFFFEKYGKRAEKRAFNSSEREKIATKVEREAEKIKKAEYMENKIGEQYDGIVSSVTSFGIFVELDSTVEGLVRFENLKDDYYFYDEANKMLIGEHTKNTYKIGDKVKVEVIDASKELRRVDFKLIEEW